MAKSIRVPDQLYRLAEHSSEGAHRSLAQQVEYWATLGRAIEAAGVTTSQAHDILNGDLRARERALLRLGLASQESMYFIPSGMAAKAKVEFPELRRKKTA